MMKWDYRFPQAPEAATPMRLGRWMVSGIVASLLAAGLYVMQGALPALARLDTWMLVAAPLLCVLGLFVFRCLLQIAGQGYYADRQHDLDCLQDAWRRWAQQSLAVYSGCAVLPDNITASILGGGAADLPLRQGDARRLAQLPEQGPGRLAQSLALLRPSVIAAMQKMPPGEALRVTLLNDQSAAGQDALSDAWKLLWTAIGGSQRVREEIVVPELDWQLLNTRLRSKKPVWELLVVLQLEGADNYSDGLAVLLLGPYALAQPQRPMLGSLCRPMPLEQQNASEPLGRFLQAQTHASKSAALLADSIQWQATLQDLCTVGRDQEWLLAPQKRWVLEQYCGLPGPFSKWLIGVFALEAARHLQAPVLMLAGDESQGWINTVLPFKP